MLKVSLTYASGEKRCPLTTQILKESCHQVQRCGLFHSYILKLSHSAVLQTRCVSQCHSLSVCLWRCHPNRKFEERKISYPFYPLGSKTEPAVQLSRGEEVEPPSFCSIFPVLSPSHSHLPAGERPLMEGCFYEASCCQWCKGAMLLWMCLTNPRCSAQPPAPSPAPHHLWHCSSNQHAGSYEFIGWPVLWFYAGGRG